MDNIILALGHPTRVSILTMIRKRGMALGKIAACYPDVSRSAISHHVDVLKKAGLLHERRKGNNHFYRFRAEGLDELKMFLKVYWNMQIVDADAAQDVSNPQSRT